MKSTHAIFILAAMLLMIFTSSGAKSQDALGTFIFLFVNTGVDVTQQYGKEYAPLRGKTWDSLFATRHRARLTSHCLFFAP